LKKVMSRWQTGLQDRGWNSIYLTNHDQPRAVSRFGNDKEYRVESAKMLATFTLMLQGTPYIYQGEEIGMTNVAFDTIEDYRDVETRNIYREMVDENCFDVKDVLDLIHAKSRDNARTPMQWDASAHAGFTKGMPWIRVNPNYPKINVEQALADRNSIFYYYQRLIRLRKTIPAVVYGKYELILPEHEEIYAFTRSLDDIRLLVILNFTKNKPIFTLPNTIDMDQAELLIGNYPVPRSEEIQFLTLRPFEARVYCLK
jgi:oligo-1,6-glucosidase